MKVKKIIAIVFLLIGIIGFFYFANQKNEKKVFDNRISGPGKTSLSLDLKENQTYEIKFWGVDEEMTGVYEQAYFEARVIIKNGLEQVLFNQELISTSETETGGKRVTHHGLEYLHSPKKDETIKIEADIKKGDYIDIEVYKGLDSESDTLPGVFIILAFIGLVLFFRSKKK